jgi:uncharacterized membrane protein
VEERTQARLPIALVVLLALLLRVYHLGHLGFWYDEGASAYLAEAGRLAVWRQDVHPPLYVALLSVWRLVADGDVWLRSLSMVFGVATVAVVHAIGRALFSPVAGMWAAGLLAVTYFHVKYSQETRMYALMGLLFAGALWGLVVAVRRARPVGWTVYVICAALLLYSHGIAVVYVATLAALFPLLAPRLDGRWGWRPWLVAHLAVGVLFLPWIAEALRDAHQVSRGFWIPPPSGPEPPLFSTLQLITVAPIPTLSAVLRSRLGLRAPAILGRWVWFAPMLAATLWVIARLARRDAAATRALVAAYALPIMLLTGLSLTVAPVLIPRVLLPTVIPIALLLGAGVDCVSRSRRVSHGVLAGVAAVLLLATVCYYQWGVKEEWREASRYLAERVGPGDLLVLDVDGSPVAGYLLRRYDPSGRLGSLATLSIGQVLETCRDEAAACLSRALDAHRAREVVWVLKAHTELWPYHDLVDAWLAAELEPPETRELDAIHVERARVRGR